MADLEIASGKGKKKAYQQPNAIGLTTAALEAQYQAFMKYGNYPLEPYHAK